MHKSIFKLYFGITALLILFSIHGAYAQDSIRMKTGAVYSVKIIEITDTHVKYRTYANPDGPLYNISKSSVDTYKLEGKTWSYFYEPVAAKKTRPGSTSKPGLQHYVSINLSDLIRTDLTIFYEVMLMNKLGIRIPVTYGFRSAYFNPVTTLSNPFGFRRNIVFKTGADLRVYAGQGYGRARFVFGPGIYYMRLNRLSSDYITSDPEYMVFKSSHAMRLLFLAGVIIRPIDALQFGFDGGMGGDIDFGEKAMPGQNLSNTPTVPKAQLNIHIGYHF